MPRKYTINKENFQKYTYKGVDYLCKDLAKHVGLSNSSLWYHLHSEKHASAEDAVEFALSLRDGNPRPCKCGCGREVKLRTHFAKQSCARNYQKQLAEKGELEPTSIGECVICGGPIKRYRAFEYTMTMQTCGKECKGKLIGLKSANKKRGKYTEKKKECVSMINDAVADSIDDEEEEVLENGAIKSTERSIRCFRKTPFTVNSCKHYDACWMVYDGKTTDGKCYGYEE
jgi:hypothetical protein